VANVVFYTDQANKFNCTIKVNGASITEAQARLVLDFGDKSIMHRGTIDADGNVKVALPAIRENYQSGKAILFSF
jgi:hypothetical protein